MNKRHLEVIKRQLKAMIIMLRHQSSSMTRLGLRTKPWDEITIKNQTTVPKSRKWIAREQLNFRVAQSKEEGRLISLHSKPHQAKVATFHKRFLNTNKTKLRSISCVPDK